MLRQSSRLLLRRTSPSHTLSTRQFLSTAPPTQKSRSWKNSAVRWGLAIGAVYYYNTSNLFAEEPPFSIPPPQGPTEETPVATLESISAKRSSASQPPPPPSEETSANTAPSSTTQAANQDLEATHEEAAQEGAYNEETGEINWDCPCLGGMAHGPCGEQFRAAFSCFVYSKEEPKGMDCIPNFKTMQDCFREHPEIYGKELEEDEEPGDAPEGEQVALSTAPTSSNSSASSETPSQLPEAGMTASSTSSAEEDATKRAQEAKAQVESAHPEPRSESDELVPKAAHDATDAIVGKSS